MPSVEIPDSRYEFNLGGVTFYLDPVEAHRALARISADTADRTNFEYADLFASWVHEQTAGAVTLTASQADWLADFIRTEYLKKKAAVWQTLQSLEFYAINPFALSAEQRLALWSNLPMMEARRTLRVLSWTPDIMLPAETLHALVLLATGDPAAADEAAAEAALRDARRANQLPPKA